MFKTNFDKAYDYVEWDFLDFVLKEKSFSEREDHQNKALLEVNKILMLQEDEGKVILFHLVILLWW